MKTLLLAFSLPLVVLAQLPAWAEENAESHLPERIARHLHGVTLTDAQQAAMQALNREFEPQIIEARRRIAAHELAQWRLGVIEQRWYERVDALLTSKQKQQPVIEALKSPTTVEFVETPLLEMIDYLQDLHHIHIDLDRSALRAAKQSTYVPITVNLRHVSLDSGLRLTLRQVGLMHVVQDDGLLITTEDQGRKLVEQGAAVSPEIDKKAAAKRLDDVLHKTIDVEFVETPLKDVTDYLMDLCHVEIQLDYRALHAAGVESDTPCTINLKTATVDAVLKQLLGKLGAKHKIQDEVILVTADAPANSRPFKPPAEEPDSKQFRPLPGERQAVERLQDLCPNLGMTTDKNGRVASLYMDASDASDEVLALAGRFEELESFSNVAGDAATSRTTDRGLAALQTASRLTELGLRGEKITDAGLASLAVLTHLRSLGLGETDITDAGVRYFFNLADLQELYLIGTRIDGSGFAALPSMDHLETLVLNDSQISDVNLKYLNRFPHLEVLGLASTRIDGSGLDIIATLPGLKKLDLNDTRLTDAGLSHLREAASLESLNLRDTAVTDAGLGQLTGLQNLKELDLSGTQITGAGLRQLAGLRNLTTINLSHTQVSDAGLKSIAALANLQILELGGTRITDVGLVELRPLSKPFYVGLSGTGITDAGLASLREIPNLKRVNVSKTPTSEKARRDLTHALEQRSAAALKKEEAPLKKAAPRSPIDPSDPFEP